MGYGTGGTTRERIAAPSAAGLRANASLDLAIVLREAVDTARALTAACYGIITTVDEAGAVREFVSSGFTEAEHRQFIEWPDGLKLFAHLRDLPGPVRLADLPALVRSLGFSPDPVRSKTFQGTPMRHRGETVGRFFLADPQGAGGGARSRARSRPTPPTTSSSPSRRPSSPRASGRRFAPARARRRSARRARHRLRAAPGDGGRARGGADRNRVRDSALPPGRRRAGGDVGVAAAPGAPPGSSTSAASATAWRGRARGEGGGRARAASMRHGGRASPWR